MARPAQFDRTEVLDNVMHLFWENGYATTGMATVLERARLQPGSLYAAFKSKRSLYQEALQRYGQSAVDQVQQLLAQADNNFRAGIMSFLNPIAAQTQKPMSLRSCFLINTLMEVTRHDAELGAQAAQYLAQIQQNLVDFLGRAASEGALTKGQDPVCAAGLIMTFAWGMRVAGMTGPDVTRIQEQVEWLLNHLFVPAT